MLHLKPIMNIIGQTRGMLTSQKSLWRGTDSNKITDEHIDLVPLWCYAARGQKGTVENLVMYCFVRKSGNFKPYKRHLQARRSTDGDLPARRRVGHFRDKLRDPSRLLLYGHQLGIGLRNGCCDKKSTTTAQLCRGCLTATTHWWDSNRKLYRKTIT